MKYKDMEHILALDLDGTMLTSDKRLTEGNLRAICRAQECGTTIVLASGRHPQSMARFADALGLRERGGYLVAFNGGQLIDYATGEMIFHHELPREVLPRLVAWARRYNLPLMSFRGNTIVTEQPTNPYIVENARNNRLPVEGVNDLAETLCSLPTPPTKCLLPGDPALLPEVEAAMKADLGEAVGIYRSAPHYLELVPPGIDKGATLLRLLSHMGLEREALIACGDQANDISMIVTAGLGVAMGNATEEVKAAADVVTGSCDEDGVAQVIDSYICKAK